MTTQAMPNPSPNNPIPRGRAARHKQTTGKTNKKKENERKRDNTPQHPSRDRRASCRARQSNSTVKPPQATRQADRIGTGRHDRQYAPQTRQTPPKQATQPPIPPSQKKENTKRTKERGQEGGGARQMTVSLFAPTHDEVRTGREGRVCGYVRSDVDKQTTRGDGSEEGEMTEVGGGWRVTR